MQLESESSETSLSFVTFLPVFFRASSGSARTLKVLNFKIMIQGLESPRKLQSVMESP